MKCIGCLAIETYWGGETGENDESICRVGEPEHEFADGSLGCLRRSKNKIRRDIDVFEARRIREMGAAAKSFMAEQEDTNEG